MQLLAVNDQAADSEDSTSQGGSCVRGSALLFQAAHPAALEHVREGPSFSQALEDNPVPLYPQLLRKPLIPWLDGALSP